MDGHPSAAVIAHRLLDRSELDLSDEERRVLASIAAGTASIRDPVEEQRASATFGDQLSDRVAAVGGS